MKTNKHRFKLLLAGLVFFGIACTGEPQAEGQGPQSNWLSRRYRIK
ncbi:hypothetical protein [Nitritalea halalkaliphila]|nr:hypothetical protein [Nitritalea halalkaliphila]